MCSVHNVHSVLVLPVLEEVMATCLLKRELFLQKRPGAGESGSLARNGISLQTFAPGDGNARSRQRGHTVPGVSSPPMLSGGAAMREGAVAVQNAATQMAAICRHILPGITCNTHERARLPTSSGPCGGLRHIHEAHDSAARTDTFVLLSSVALGPLVLGWLERFAVRSHSLVLSEMSAWNRILNLLSQVVSSQRFILTVLLVLA
jgi:hypothetical protein